VNHVCPKNLQNSTGRLEISYSGVASIHRDYSKDNRTDWTVKTFQKRLQSRASEARKVMFINFVREVFVCQCWGCRRSVVLPATRGINPWPFVFACKCGEVSTFKKEDISKELPKAEDITIPTAVYKLSVHSKMLIQLAHDLDSKCLWRLELECNPGTETHPEVTLVHTLTSCSHAERDLQSMALVGCKGRLRPGVAPKIKSSVPWFQYDFKNPKREELFRLVPH
jgi:hypothetical protein